MKLAFDYSAHARGALRSIVSNAILANYPAWASTFWNREVLYYVQYIRGGALEDSGRTIVRPLRVTICTITSCNTDTLARIHYAEVLITLDSSSLPWFPKIANLGSAVHHCKCISFCAEFPCHDQAPGIKTKTIGLSRSNVCVLALNALDTFRGWLALLRCPRPDYIMPPLLTTSPLLYFFCCEGCNV